MAKRKEDRNANYNFQDQVEPKRRMGQGSFANLPEEAKILKFDNTPQYRDGLINSFTANIEEISEIYENRRGE